VVRGVEGGGRMYGHRSLWPLLAEVLDAVEVPVLAAGGIATGRLLAAGLAAGAGGVRVGTRFVATVESGAHPRYKSALADASGGETVLTDAFRVMWPDEVRTARVLQSALETANSADDPVGKMTMGPVEIDVPRFGVAPPSTTATGNIEAMALYAGRVGRRDLDRRARGRGPSAHGRRRRGLARSVSSALTSGRAVGHIAHE
jgi:nitronate monooxygenase